MLQIPVTPSRALQLLVARDKQVLFVGGNWNVLFDLVVLKGRAMVSHRMCEPKQLALRACSWFGYWEMQVALDLP